MDGSGSDLFVSRYVGIKSRCSGRWIWFWTMGRENGFPNLWSVVAFVALDFLLCLLAAAVISPVGLDWSLSLVLSSAVAADLNASSRKVGEIMEV